MKTIKEKKWKILRNIAIKLHKQGFTTREIGAKIGKSHAWVAYVIKEKKNA
jgi:hypothetical protein